MELTLEKSRLGRELSRLALSHNGDGSSAEVRRVALALVRQALQDGHGEAERLLLAEGGGTACATRISGLMDEIICALHDFAISHVYRMTNRSAAERMAVIAVGGYGRGTLAPSSDIDLLFLLPYKQTPWGEQVLEYILYFLWDLGLKVGHATRTVDECIRMSRSDITVRTAVLEARFIRGDLRLHEELLERFDSEVAHDTGAEFIEAKLAERDHRHRRQGESRYLVEPNVKDGKGGLRDLHTLFWIGKYYYGVRSGEELIGKGVFTRAEFTRFQKAEDFLWAVRCHMHFLTGKAEERLHFELQPDIAARLRFTGSASLSAVESFMKSYFLIAKQVGDLTRIFCTVLEVEQSKKLPGGESVPGRLVKGGRKLPGAPGFMVENHRLDIASNEVFEDDPVNLLRLFWHADRHSLELHPNALRLVTRSLGLVSRKLRGNPEANKLFLDCLTSSRSPEMNMRRMNEAGILGRLIPDFGRIVAMMQFSLYHHYTVDEHLLRCLGVLSEIEHGKAEEAHPLSHRLMPELRHRRTLLYVATLFHDIGKGRQEAHEIVGGRIVRKRCPHMGLSDDETELVAWLVEHHLVMSTFAQSRDLNDRKTIEDFAAIVQSVERLKLLLILTVCDIRGVGPGVWNGWKGQLLRTLYFETELVLTGGFAAAKASERVNEARAELVAGLAGWSEADRERYADLHYGNYLLTVDPGDRIRHAEFLRDVDREGRKFAFSVRPNAFQAVTEIIVLAGDHPRLLSMIAGACAAVGANIVDAQIFTTRDGRAFDIIMISRAFERDEDELRRGHRIGRLIGEVLAGKTQLKQMIEKRTQARRISRAFKVVARVEIRNTLSHKFSVIEVKGRDWPGLLHAVTGAISDLSLNIASAHISTFGEKAIDTFYVTDLLGHKIEDGKRQEQIRARLLEALENRPANGNPNAASTARQKGTTA